MRRNLSSRRLLTTSTGIIAAPSQPVWELNYRGISTIVVDFSVFCSSSIFLIKLGSIKVTLQQLCLQSLLWAMRRAGLNPTEPEMMVKFKSNLIEEATKFEIGVLLVIWFKALQDMINHIDEHNTGILDFPAFYNLVKKKSRDQVNGKIQKVLNRTNPQIASNLQNNSRGRGGSIFCVQIFATFQDNFTQKFPEKTRNIVSWRARGCVFVCQVLFWISGSDFP